MVQSFYSLQQAAEVLGISEDELKRMAQSRDVRAFADGGSWKFRQQDIEELARTRQFGSEPDIRLSESASDSASDDILGEDEQVMLDGLSGNDFGADDSAKTIIGVKGGGSASDSDVRLLLSDENGADSDVRLVGESNASLGGSGIDDAVDLGEDIAKAPSDSDIRMTFEDSLVTPGRGSRKQDSDFGERTEEITLREEDFDLAVSGRGPVDASNVEDEIDQSASDDDLDFNFDDDMSTGFKVEGNSDFDLAGFESEDDLAARPASGKAKPGNEDLTIPIDTIRLQDDDDDDDIGLADDSDITAGAAQSGINLNRPDDSGISLESSDLESSDSEFELSLDSDSETDIFGSDEIPAFKDDDDDHVGISASDSAETEEVSDSDFELAIDEDFEEDEESGSEVVAIDEDDEEEVATGDYDEDYEDYDEVAATGQPVSIPRGATGVATQANPPWPGWLAAPLALTACLLIMCGIMMVEVMRNAWSHQTPYALSGSMINIVYDLAKTIGLAK